MIVGSKYASDWDSFFCAQQFHQKLGSFIHLFLLFVHNCSTKISSHSYSSIHYFLNCANTMYAIFMVELLLHIYERTVLIFHALYLWIHSIQNFTEHGLDFGEISTCLYIVGHTLKR